MIFHERDLVAIENGGGALHPSHHADCNGGGEFIREDQVDVGIDDLARLDAIEAGVAGQNFFGECHPHKQSGSWRVTQNPGLMILTSAAERKALLERSSTVAMVGASPKQDRPSHGVFAYLRAHGFDVTPVAPNVSEIHGVKGYPNLTAYAAERGAPDIVEVFRNPSEVLPIVDEAIAIGAKAIWFQLGVVNEEAIDRADKAGLTVVFDKCMKVEHRALVSG